MALVGHLDNAEMTSELCHNLVDFSFDCLHDFFKGYKNNYEDWYYNVHIFTPHFLDCLKRLVRYHFYNSSVLQIFIR